MLEPWFLNCSLVFHSAVLLLLILLFYFHTFNVLSQWGYFTIQILPVAIGTITASYLEGIARTLNRLTPFILCASSDGAIAGDTLLGQYFPSPSLLQAWNTRNLLLLSAWLMFIIGSLIQAFKASLLNTTSDGMAIVALWALIPISAIYCLVVIFNITVIWWLRSKKSSGLRWDPVSIADHLMLFRHSNFLTYFEGTDMANRESMFETLKHLRLRLGYWKRENGDIWHGFGMLKRGHSEVGAIGTRDPPRKRR